MRKESHLGLRQVIRKSQNIDRDGSREKRIRRIRLSIKVEEEERLPRPGAIDPEMTIEEAVNVKYVNKYCDPPLNFSIMVKLFSFPSTFCTLF